MTSLCTWPETNCTVLRSTFFLRDKMTTHYLTQTSCPNISEVLEVYFNVRCVTCLLCVVVRVGATIENTTEHWCGTYRPKVTREQISKCTSMGLAVLTGRSDDEVQAAG